MEINVLPIEKMYLIHITFFSNFFPLIIYLSSNIKALNCVVCVCVCDGFWLCIHMCFHLQFFVSPLHPHDSSEHLLIDYLENNLTQTSESGVFLLSTAKRTDEKRGKHILNQIQSIASSQQLGN